jgi:transcription factor IIIB subunit 2
MVYCNYCEVEVEVEVDDANGFSCCVQCGRVLEDTAFSADVTFQKDAGGESTVLGQFVNEAGVARGIGRIHGGRVYSYSADSHEKAQQRGRHDIAHLVDQLSVRPREESIESAHRLYKIALQRGFTRGRRTNQVAAACLYLVCRQDSKPFLLIDFSDVLQINVFTLGAVFLQLAKLLRVTEHPMFAKPVDPSLYIHRFADRLDFGRQMHQVANTALRLVSGDEVVRCIAPGWSRVSAAVLVCRRRGLPQQSNIVTLAQPCLPSRFYPAGGLHEARLDPDGAPPLRHLRRSHLHRGPHPRL